MAWGSPPYGLPCPLLRRRWLSFLPCEARGARRHALRERLSKHHLLSWKLFSWEEVPAGAQTPALTSHRPAAPDLEAGQGRGFRAPGVGGAVGVAPLTAVPHIKGLSS